MAHFLEHLVFKGGEKYDDYRDVNETAERIGAQLNAYTSHDLVAFHITVRAEARHRGDGPAHRLRRRPKIDAEELDRERGVVIQEIARVDDQPSTVAEQLIDRAAFGDHPLGRTVLGPAEHLRDTFTRDGDRRLPRAPLVGPPRRRVHRRQRRPRARGRRGGRAVRALPRLPAPRPTSRRPPSSREVIVEERDSNQSHLRMSYRPTIDVADPARARR